MDRTFGSMYITCNIRNWHPLLDQVANQRRLGDMVCRQPVRLLGVSPTTAFLVHLEGRNAELQPTDPELTDRVRMCLHRCPATIIMPPAGGLHKHPCTTTLDRNMAMVKASDGMRRAIPA
jgi:hypothetical protein